MRPSRYIACLILLLSVCVFAQGGSQRLILKDGSYQVVTKYKVVKDRVRYISAERDGEWEELPSNLVDWPATEKWAREHSPDAASGAPATESSPASAEASAIDKEEAAERADLAARTPQVAPGLRLPDSDGVWVMDTFQGQPELVELLQNSGNVNENRTHNVLRAAINPFGGTRQLVQIEGPRSKVQFHVNQPVIYVSIDPDDKVGDLPMAQGPEHTVDTHGAGSIKDKNTHSSPSSRYAIVKVQAKRNTRVIAAMNVSMLGNVSQSENFVDTQAEVLPGRHWMKLIPKEPLSIGEYALMEVLSPKEMNLSVWDFGVDPRAPESKNALTPIKESY
ncbi:MAG TPA: hypothetical protein VGD64_13085 [Acidisarcina sp.]